MKPSLKRLLFLAAILPAGCTPPSSSDDAGVPAVFSSSGSLVPGFGGGIVTSNPSGGYDEATAIVVDSAFFYVAGTQRGTGTSSEVQWRIEKRDLDKGEAAVVVNSDPSASVDEPKAMATDGTHLYIVGTENTGWRVEKRLLADLSLVAGFGIGGAVTNSPLSFFSAPAAMAIDSTHMYIVGKDDNQWRIEKRSLGTGALDVAGFGGGTGIVLSDPTFAGDEARAIAIDAAHIYIAGIQGSDWRIEKRDLLTGELDVTEFGGSTGAITIDTGIYSDEATAIAIDDQFLYVAGHEATGNFGFDRRWRVEKRSLSTGELETTTFGGGTGVITSDPSLGDDRPVALVVAPGSPSTSFLVVGFDDDSASERWRVEKRSLSTGLLDPDFASGGVLAEDASLGDDRPTAAAVTAKSNQLVVAGFDMTPLERQWRISRWDMATGLLAPFSGLGSISSNLGQSQMAIHVATDDEFLYIAGQVHQQVPNVRRLEKRRLSDGALVLEIELGNGPIPRIALDENHIYLAGSVDLQGRIEKRFKSDFSLDGTFGTAGIIQLDATGWTGFTAIALSGSSMCLLAAAENGAFLQKRSMADGALDLGFGIDGVAAVDDDLTEGLAVDDIDLYIAGTWGIQKRSLSDGSVVPSFGSGGFIQIDPVGQSSITVGIAVVGTSLYHLGERDFTEEFGTSQWILHKLRTSDGTFDVNFGFTGMAVSTPGPRGAFGGPQALAAEAGYVYVGGTVDNQWHLEKRNSVGERVLDFGEAGVISTMPTQSQNIVRGLALKEDFLFAVGSERSNGAWRIEKRLK